MRKILTGLLCAVVAAAAEAASLPFGYEAVEYIESTLNGGQYINTGYIHKENTKIACEVGASESQQSGTGWAAAFGACHYGWENNAFVFFIRDSNDFVRYNRTKREDAGGKFVFPRNVRTTITCEGRTAKWSTAGSSRSITLDDGAIVDKGDCPMLIFEKNRSDEGGVVLDNSRAVMKLYSFKIYEGDDTRPVRDFVPCLERATGKAGLYETVEGKFYGNAGNGGDFLTAQPSGYRPVEYIESTPGGGQYIDTGYVAKPTTRFEIGSEPMIKSIPDFSKFLQGEVVKVRWLKIYEGDVLVRDFVPCVEAATGEAGLRDRIGGAFYRNEGAYCFNTPMSFGRVLTSGTYAFEESFMYAAPATESALKIAENSRVTLRIPAGVTVTLFGGNAQGKVGAGAGIEVPPTSSLSVVGDGKLVVLGGNAANGNAGKAAPEGWIRTNSDGSGEDYNGRKGPQTALYFCNGDGGAGGDGGGGAGAGIGGRGGNGGAGGAGAALTIRNWSEVNTFPTFGLPGAAGVHGDVGGEPGEIMIAETLTVDARSGDAGKGGAGGAGASVHFSWIVRYWGAWGGGGGGGGGAGAAAYAGIGVGGVGGGGGGGGGSGAIDYFGSIKNFLSYDQYGAGGLGGQGMTGNIAGNGEPGKNKCGEEITIVDGDNKVTGRTGQGGGDADDWKRPGGPGAGGAAGTFSLPSGYEQIEYIESTPGGGQYINTGCTPHTNTTVVCRLRDDGTGLPPGESASGAVFGSGIGIGEHRGMSFWLRQSGVVKPYYGRAGDGGGKNKESFPFGDITTVNCHGRRCSWVSDAGTKTNGIELTSEFYEEDQEEGVAPMTIFALNAQDEKGVCQPADFWHFKLYGFQIYEGARMVRNFIPCIELETGKSGLYDLVGRKFYGNAGGGAGFKPELPPEYRRVEYIESTKVGGQYIDTEYTHKANTRISCEVSVANAGHPATCAAVFGSRPGEWSESTRGSLVFFSRFWGALPAWEYQVGCESGVTKGTENSFPYEKRVGIFADVAARSVSWFSDNHEYRLDSNQKELSEGKSPLFIFDFNVGPNGTAKPCGQRCVMKLYSFKIYEGDELVRSYVPCVNASGVAGLYELINGGFCTNAGTGAFNVGPLAVPYWDPAAQVTRSAFCEIVTKDTAKLEGGKWYAVTNSIERGMIEVNGSANLILCDNATLTATGAKDQAGVRVAKGHSLVIYGQVGGTGALVAKGGLEAAGIGGGEKQAGGTITINGGVVTATGVQHGAGIGGGDVGAGGTVTINGGTVTATGGDGGAGIGGGRKGGGGTVTINGGTVTATGGWNSAGIGGGPNGAGGTVTINGGMVMSNAGANSASIGGGCCGAGGIVTINGGTVTANNRHNAVEIGAGCGGSAHGTLTINGGNLNVKLEVGPRPVNCDWELLQHVIVKTDDLLDPADGLRIIGLPNYYGTVDVHPVNNQIHLWLPSSREGYLFWVGDGQKSHTYFVEVAGRAVTATRLEAGLRVNGQDITSLIGDGWSYDAESGLLTLNKQMNYVLEGIATNGNVRIAVTANANVTLSNAVINAVSAPTITVNDGCTLRLSTVDDGASYLLADVRQPVIRGGKTVVERGTLCLWADGTVPVDCAAGGFTVATNEIMSIGKDLDNLRYVNKYEPKDGDQILIVGMRCQLTVPFVSNATVRVGNLSLSEDAIGTPTEAGMVYDVMDGDTVAVLVIPDDGYVLRGPAAEQWFDINGDTKLEPTDLPVAMEGLFASYRTVTVDEVGNVAYGHAVAGATLFDAIADRPDVVGKGEYGEEWYVVTGEVDCASICVTEGTVNLILYPSAVLTLTGEDGAPGVGVMSNACLNIYGRDFDDFGDVDDADDDYYGDRIGTLVAVGGTYAAGIGGGGAEVLDDAPGADAGMITVNGGQVIAYGGDFGAGIGGGAFGAGAYLEVNGGSVFAYCGWDAEDIGGGAYGEDGVTVVNGGNVMGNSVEAKPVKVNTKPVKSSDDVWEQLYRVYVVSEAFIREDGKALTIEGLGGFGTADIFPNEDGAICLYLPNGTYEFSVDGVKYVAVVADETATAEKKDESEEGGSEEGEGESEEGGGRVLGIEVDGVVKITVRAEEGRTYRLRRVTLVDGKWVDGDIVWSATATDDILMEESATLTLEDNNPPAGSCFYVVEEER